MAHVRHNGKAVYLPYARYLLTALRFIGSSPARDTLDPPYSPRVACRIGIAKDEIKY